MYKEITTCPISNDENPIRYIDLGNMPLVNNLCDTRDQSLNCQKFPLKVNFFEKSGLSSLSIAIEPEILFSHYVYKSGTSAPYIKHCHDMYSYIKEFVEINDGDKFVDIGGNDGTLLKTFKEINPNISVLNVDPSDTTEISEQNGIPAHKAMWDSTVGNDLRNSCKVITSTNVFQHTQPIRDFVKGVVAGLSDDGVWCLEFPYWSKSLKTLQYDQIYHEHIYYYLLRPLVDLFEQEGLEIVDVTERSIHGGSMRVLSKKKGNEPICQMAKNHYLNLEKEYTKEYYEMSEILIRNHIRDSKRIIQDLKNNGLKIAAFGAAAKGCIFLNACGLDYNTIDYIVDDTDTKQNKFMPGTGIEIVNREMLIENPPDYLIILAHNFGEYIRLSLREIYKGKFIIFFPEIKFIEDVTLRMLL